MVAVASKLVLTDTTVRYMLPILLASLLPCLLTLFWQTKIAFVDGALTTNIDIVESLAIDGFPTLIAYKRGQRLPEYSGPRTAQ